MTNPNPRYVIDGHESENEESNLTGDGRFPPFYILDTDAQRCLPGSHETRRKAQAALRNMLARKKQTERN